MYVSESRYGTKLLACRKGNACLTTVTSNKWSQSDSTPSRINVGTAMIARQGTSNRGQYLFGKPKLSSFPMNCIAAINDC
jgi:hypothetical protein